MRSAISPERSALPLSRLDRAGRETWSAAAAAVTERPAGLIISVRIKSPGWGGVLMGMAVTPFILVVVLQVHIDNLSLGGVYAEREAAAARDAQAPCSPTVTGEHTDPPPWQGAQSR